GETSGRLGDPVVTSSSESAACKKNDLPDFPWPAPRPSGRMALPRSLLGVHEGPSTSLKEVADELDKLMLSAGYAERSYFTLRDASDVLGFAVVTRMERIYRDGRPYPAEKRFRPVDAPDQFSVGAFLRSLFVAPVGFYRVIVMTVARKPVPSGRTPMLESDAQALLRTGGARLTGCVARMRYTEAHNIDALIYEFRHAPEEAASANKSVLQLKPGTLDASLHLRRAGIIAPRMLRR
ncbi:MAG: hypothetical protein AAFV29_27555, partial [Myxococcota bacterium]